VLRHVGFFSSGGWISGRSSDCQSGTQQRLRAQEMFMNFSPILADYIWIGGGTLGLILVIIVVVLLLRRA
jgi:hypothetical protein